MAMGINPVKRKRSQSSHIIPGKFTQRLLHSICYTAFAYDSLTEKKRKLAHTCLNPREFAQTSLGKKFAEILKSQCACHILKAALTFSPTFHTKINLSRSSSNLGNSKMLPTSESKRFAMYTGRRPSSRNGHLDCCATTALVSDQGRHFQKKREETIPAVYNPVQTGSRHRCNALCQLERS